MNQPSHLNLDVQFLRSRDRRFREILSGKRLPTSQDMMEGLPPFRGDLLQSMSAMAAYYQTELQDNQRLVAALRTLEAMPNVSHLIAVLELIDGDAHPEFDYRVKWHLALAGDECSIDDVKGYDRSRLATLSLMHIQAFGRGLKACYNDGGLGSTTIINTEEIMRRGLHLLGGEHLEIVARYYAARAHMKSEIDQTVAAIEATHSDLLELVAEDRAESQVDLELPANTVIVVSGATVEGSKERRKVRETYQDIIGQPLPLVTRGDVSDHYAKLASRWCHLTEEIGVILSDLSTQDPVWIRPTILVGGVGTGKSSLARAIGKQLGLPTITYNCGGLRDAMFGGISANFSTAAPSVPVQVIRDGGVANPLVILDEVEKASADRDTGALVDMLLGFLDRENARAYRDPALECDVDVSWVNYLLTVNDIDLVPAPLRDRCRVIEVPDPTWKHVGSLTRTILEDVAREQGLDPRWHAPLAPDELDVIRGTWNGGSLRRLRRAVEIMLDGRESLMARA